MIVNNSHRFLFIHVPKAAGTSVTRELSRFTTFRDIEVGGTRYGEKVQDMYAARFDLRKHSPAAKIRAKAGPEVWRGYFVFAFVRSPYARAYSLWKFLRRWKDGPHHALAAELGFEDFIASDEVRSGAIDIAKPQTSWLTDAEGRLMDGIDFVGRVERFDEDFAFILSMIARRPTSFKAEVRENASAEVSEWETAMTPKAQAAIEDIYAADFLLFDYAKREAALAA
ncbi:MAG: sulfotransferase family 2 domain-containing protein [Pseudomonadota bacterium]